MYLCIKISVYYRGLNLTLTTCGRNTHHGDCRRCYSDLLASGLSSTLDYTVVTYEQYKKEESKPKSKRDTYFQALNIDQIFKLTNRAGIIGDVVVSHGIHLYIKSTLTGKTLTIKVAEDELVEGLKGKIEAVMGALPNDQRLLFNDKHLQSTTISECGIVNGDTLHLMILNRSWRRKAHFLYRRFPAASTTMTSQGW